MDPTEWVETLDRSCPQLVMRKQMALTMSFGSSMATLKNSRSLIYSCYGRAG